MRTLPRLGAFDLVMCVDDALNHLLTPADLRDAIASLARNLAPRGVVVFDLNTLSTLRSVFSADSSSADGSAVCCGAASAIRRSRRAASRAPS